MNDLIGRVFHFEKSVFPNQSDLYARLATHGQQPKALIISCADSRVVPELILQADPGDLFVCRNAGNIVPPYAVANGGVTSTVEYAVAALAVRDIIVCGHSGCGAMKALSQPGSTDGMPNVAAWLRHAETAATVVRDCHPELAGDDRVRAITLENIVAQLANIRTHPTVAAGLAAGRLTLHGWYVDIGAGRILGLDGASGRFVPLDERHPLPIAVLPRDAADPMLQAAE